NIWYLHRPKQNFTECEVRNPVISLCQNIPNFLLTMASSLSSDSESDLDTSNSNSYDGQDSSDVNDNDGIMKPYSFEPEKPDTAGDDSSDCEAKTDGRLADKAKSW
ncbi:unnamed protein product, partial [Meganyctiphanes norvegica]